MIEMSKGTWVILSVGAQGAKRNDTNLDGAARKKPISNALEEFGHGRKRNQKCKTFSSTVF